MRNCIKIGLSSQNIIMILDYLKENTDANSVVLDPHIDIIRAIRSYQKAGFKIVKVLPKHEMHEGKELDCYLMEYRLRIDKYKKGRILIWKINLYV